MVLDIGVSPKKISGDFKISNISCSGRIANFEFEGIYTVFCWRYKFCRIFRHIVHNNKTEKNSLRLSEISI